MRQLLLILLAVFITGCGITAKEVETQYLSSPLSFDELSGVMTSPKMICHVAENEIVYTPDVFYSDECRTPKQTWSMRGGDCEDYALFCAYFLERLGIETKIVVIIGERYCHAICTWQIDNVYYYCTNGKYIAPMADNITDVVQAEHSSWTKYYYCNYDEVVFNGHIPNTSGSILK